MSGSARRKSESGEGKANNSNLVPPLIKKNAKNLNNEETKRKTRKSDQS